MARTFVTSNQVKTHVMLLGKTGVGKTDTAKAFTQALERGDYPALKGKKVFYLNAAELVGNNESFSSGNRTLVRIKEAMGRHREQIILVIDEIHLACQHREHSAVSEQLKTLLDPSQEGFPYVIGITTEEEYYRDIYLNNEAFARRFKRINVENTTQEETQRILSAVLIQKAPDVLIAPETLQLFYQKIEEAFPGTAAPAMHLKILSQCIERVSSMQKMPLEEEIEALRNKIQSQRSASILGQGKRLLPHGQQQSAKQIQDLAIELQKKEAIQAEKKAQVQELFSKRKDLGWIKQMTYQSVQKLTQVTHGTPVKEDANKKRFLLFSHLIGPSLEQHVRNQSQNLGIKVEIDSSVIDEIIAKEKTLRDKAIQTASRGHADIQARQTSIQERKLAI
jgi:ATP-dependent Clp protease ATP-binding subunit ClpA